MQTSVASIVALGSRKVGTVLLRCSTQILPHWQIMTHSVVSALLSMCVHIVELKAEVQHGAHQRGVLGPASVRQAGCWARPCYHMR